MTTDRSRRTRLTVETLENRLAPATRLGAYAMTYNDVDGDLVTVRFTNPILTSDVVAHVYLDFEDMGFGHERLRRIALTAGAVPAGTGVSVTAVRGPDGGNGLVNVGRVNGTGKDLGAVIIDGDLGQIDAGDLGTPNRGLASLTAQSIGRFGTATQAFGGDLHSEIRGRVGALTVKGDIIGARIEVGLFGGAGSIGALRVRGSIIGGDELQSGSIMVNGPIGSVFVRGDLSGGGANLTGAIMSLGGIPNGVTVGGSLRGGAGELSGSLSSLGDMGLVNIAGNITGGGGSGSGTLATPGRLAGITVGGSVRGSTVATLNPNGQISAGSVGPVTIGGDLVGGEAVESGSIDCDGAAGAIWIKGDVVGGDGGSSGSIRTDGLASFRLGGSLRGGAGSTSAWVTSLNTMGPVNIRGDVLGGSGLNSGSIDANRVGPVSVLGSVVGGTHDRTGRIMGVASMGAVTVGGSVIGGSRDESGCVKSAFGNLGPVRITGDLVGGNIFFAGGSLEQSGYIAGTRIASLFVGGSIIAGRRGALSSLDKSGSVRAHEHIGPVTVRGNLIGNPANPVVISARGRAGLPATATTDLTIASLTVGGRVEYADILAGYDPDLVARNADAQIGLVTVGGDWIASDLVAGVAAGGDSYFGGPDDIRIAEAGGHDPDIIARIAGVAIRGQAMGVVGGLAEFGLCAEAIGSLSIGGTVIRLRPGPGNDQYVIAPDPADNLFLREV